MKSINELIKYTDAYKQLKNKGLVQDKEEVNELDLLFGGFKSMYNDMSNSKTYKK